jgi:hypothetical protein
MVSPERVETSHLSLNGGTAMRSHALNRRTFLRRTAGVAGSVSVAAVFQNYLAQPARGAVFGPLSPVADETTGLPLIQLPEGFRYISYGWAGDSLRDGTPTPGAADGMGVVFAHGARVLLVRNHEVRTAGTALGKTSQHITYDPNGAAGTVNLAFNRKTGKWIESWLSIVGTSVNCAGGVTPWGSWLTCEETMIGPPSLGVSMTHGWCYEVPALQKANPVPLTAMGRFSHEAIAVDPATGIVYETEDLRHASGFYRFLPNTPNKLFGLEDGGELQMLKVVGVDNAVLINVSAGDEFDVEWVTIDGPALTAGQVALSAAVGDFDGSTSNASAVFKQGWEEKGAARFRRLEGCWPADGVIYFTDTEAGPMAADTGEREGAVWCYDAGAEKLRCIYAAPAEAELDNPDNVTVAPDGSLFLCEDGDLSGQRLSHLTLDGAICPFAQNNVQLNGEVNGISGDFRGAEWAGACFEPSGEWMFANVFSPGITLAITGPWPWL